MASVLGWLLLAGLVAAPHGQDDKKILALIEKLDHDEVNVRSDAESALLEMGEKILPFLEKARDGSSAEVRLRLDRLVSDLNRPKEWAKELMEETEPHRAYQRVTQAIQSGELMKRHLPRMLSLIFLDEDANDQLKQYLYNIARRHKVRGIWPALLELAKRSEQDASYVMSHFQQCKPPKEAAEAILRALPEIHGYNATQFLQLAVRLDPDPAKVDAAVRAVVESDADDNVLTNLLGAVSQGSVKIFLRTAILCWERRTSLNPYVRQALLRTAPDDSVDKVIAWLDSPQDEEVQLAAEYIARHKVARAGRALVDAIGRRTVPSSETLTPAHQIRQKFLGALRAIDFEKLVREWLASREDAPSPGVLLGLAGELKLKGLAPEVVKLLEDPDAAVRGASARAAGDLRLDGAVEKLEGRLGDKSVAVRREALRALARIRGAEVTALVLEQYRSGHPDVQAQAIELLPLMDLEAVLGELTSEQGLSRPMAKQALATLVAHLGESMLQRILARVGDRISVEEFEAQVRLIKVSR